jgi:hypothetical protein
LSDVGRICSVEAVLVVHRQGANYHVYHERNNSLSAPTVGICAVKPARKHDDGESGALPLLVRPSDSTTFASWFDEGEMF